jgi:hypothetical protein
MMYRRAVGTLALVAALAMSAAGARAFDDASYPDWSGSWLKTEGANSGNFDPSKPRGPGQQTPLKPEFQKVLDASLADIAKGGQGNDPGYLCGSHGMPRVMIANVPIFFVILPQTTYVILERLSQVRRIFTDGRGWPAQLPGASLGYSIGRWIDTDGDGVYDVLEAETRGFKGPRVYDASGLPLHFDNQSVFKERFYLDKADPKTIHDEVTVIDHALTRPWVVDKRYVHESNPHPDWREGSCIEGSDLVALGKEMYILRADGLLMPAKKDQPPPDLRYFNRASK